MATMLQRIQAMIDGKAPVPPIGELIGFTLVSISPGQATFKMKAETRHHNPMGTLHGGVLADLTDAAMGMAFASTLDEGESFTTLELKLNFFKPIRDGELNAVGKIVKRGQTVGMVEADVTDSQGALVARASSTCMVLRGPQASGR